MGSWDNCQGTLDMSHTHQNKPQEARSRDGHYYPESLDKGYVSASRHLSEPINKYTPIIYDYTQRD